MPKRWVIPDLHGYVLTVQALFRDIIRPDREDVIWFLGDCIDRGPDSKGVIDFIRTLQADGFNVTALKGNHEDMLVELYDAEIQSKNQWFLNFSSRKRNAWLEMGGKETLRSFGAASVTEIPPDYIEWMRAMPYYALQEEFVLVHAGLNFRNEDPFEDTLSMLWLRDFEIRPEKIGYRRIIHGHVPVPMEMIRLTIRNKGYKFIDLDNGIYVRGRNEFGRLAALELNSMELVVQGNVDGEMVRW